MGASAFGSPLGLNSVNPLGSFAASNQFRSQPLGFSQQPFGFSQQPQSFSQQPLPGFGSNQFTSFPQQYASSQFSAAPTQFSNAPPGLIPIGNIYSGGLPNTWTSGPTPKSSGNTYSVNTTGTSGQSASSSVFNIPAGSTSATTTPK